MENGSPIMVEYLRKVSEKLDKIKLEAYERMKRRSMFVNMKDCSDLVKVTVQDMNGESVTDKKIAEKKEEIVQKDKKKRKRKGIKAFMEDEKEAEAFEKEEQSNQKEEEKPVKKAKKSVGFNLE